MRVNRAFLPVRGGHVGMQHINVAMGGLLIPVIASLSSLSSNVTFFRLLINQIFINLQGFF